MIRRGFYRGIGEAPRRKDWKPKALPAEVKGKKGIRPARDILTLAEGRFDDSHGRNLIVEQHVSGENKKGYMAFLTISHIPDKSPFPGLEWLYHLQNLSFPVEAVRPDGDDRVRQSVIPGVEEEKRTESRGRTRSGKRRGNCISHFAQPPGCQ